MTNLVTDIAATVEERPAATAVAYDGRETSYEALWEGVGAFAAALADRGVGPDDRVAVYLPNLPQFVTAFLGTLRAGAVVVPMNPQYRTREIEHLLGDSEARVVVTLPDLAGQVAEVRARTEVEHVVTVGGSAAGTVAFEAFRGDSDFETVAREDDDVAVQPYTSGTTGAPKGVLLTHRNLAWNARASAALMEDGVRPDDRFLGVLPLFHIYGMTVVMLAPLFGGAAYYPLPEWDPEAALDLIEREAITVFHGVPAMFNDVVNRLDADEYDLSSLRFVNSGGSAMPAEVRDRFEATFDVDLYEGYGLTETSPVTHANYEGKRRAGAIGVPIEGVDAMIVDEDFEEVPPVEEGPIEEGSDVADLEAVTGELVVAGPNVMKGYAGLPEANDEAFTERDGTRWFHTGDVGYRDEDGFYYVVDRKTHVITTGGYNVYPREVEELLFEHEAVADAAVVGVPDERRGETVKAFVVTHPDAEVTADDIREYCLDNLAAYKHPREVEFVEELPRTTTGKVQKFELRDEDAEGAEDTEDAPE